jgi:hypothetical protein
VEPTASAEPSANVVANAKKTAARRTASAEPSAPRKTASASLLIASARLLRAHAELHASVRRLESVSVALVASVPAVQARAAARRRAVVSCLR